MCDLLTGHSVQCHDLVPSFFAPSLDNQLQHHRAEVSGVAACFKEGDRLGFHFRVVGGNQQVDDGRLTNES